MSIKYRSVRPASKSLVVFCSCAIVFSFMTRCRVECFVLSARFHDTCFITAGNSSKKVSGLTYLISPLWTRLMWPDVGRLN